MKVRSRGHKAHTAPAQVIAARKPLNEQRGVIWAETFIDIWRYILFDDGGMWWDDCFQVLQVSWYESVVSLAHPLEPAYCGMIC